MIFNGLGCEDRPWVFVSKNRDERADILTLSTLMFRVQAELGDGAILIHPDSFLLAFYRSDTSTPEWQPRLLNCVITDDLVVFRVSAEGDGYTLRRPVQGDVDARPLNEVYIEQKRQSIPCSLSVDFHEKKKDGMAELCISFHEAAGSGGGDHEAG